MSQADRSHAFWVPADAPEPAEGFMVAYGANIIFT